MIGDNQWISKFKTIASKFKTYEIVHKLKKNLDLTTNYQVAFFLASLIAHIQINKNYDFNINIDDMIFLRPDYNFLVNNDKLNSKNISLKFSLSITNKLINISINNKEIDSKTFKNIKEHFLVLIKDKSPVDNLILIIPTFNFSMKGGQFVHNNKLPHLPGIQAGVGYNPEIHTKEGIQIGQYKSNAIDMEDLPEEHQDYNSSQHPNDPLFGTKSVNTLIAKKKLENKNFEEGFGVGFNNGYNKGYYFGYSAAAAYLYRYYKKFYRDHMEKLKQKIIEDNENEKIESKKQQFNDFFSFNFFNTNSNNETTTSEDEEDDEEDEESVQKGGYISVIEEEEEQEKIFAIKDKFSKMTGHDFDYEPIASQRQIDELNEDKIFEGLPDYMMPENTFSLRSLQPRQHTILGLISDFFLPIKKSENPDFHCKKPSQDDLNKMFRLYFEPQFRDSIVSADKNWNERIFQKSCNRYSLMVMKYCPTENHAGVEFDSKVGAFHKVCKRVKDEKDYCVIM